jgi:hypothetical protein
VKIGSSLYNEPLGNVGIGVSVPTHRLHVESSNTPNLTGIVHSESTAPPGLNRDVSAFYGVSDVDDYYGIGVTFIGGW